MSDGTNLSFDNLWFQLALLIFTLGIVGFVALTWIIWDSIKMDDWLGGALVILCLILILFLAL